MCSGTGLLITTFSEAALQVLVAVTVQTTSVPGITLPAGASSLVFSPLAPTTSFSTSAVVLSTMQPCVCAKTCDPKAQASNAAALTNFDVLSIMCNSFTALPRSIDGHGELDCLSTTRLGESSKRHVHVRAGSSQKTAGIGIGRVGEHRAVEPQRARHVGGVGRDVVGEHRSGGRPRTRSRDHDGVVDACARHRTRATELVGHGLRLHGGERDAGDQVLAGGLADRAGGA